MNWPDVPECQGHGRDKVATCPQCDGGHAHVWQAGTGALTGSVRCVVCGGRKCDVGSCVERRHHAGPHLGDDGTIRQVGR